MSLKIRKFQKMRSFFVFKKAKTSFEPSNKCKKRKMGGGQIETSAKEGGKGILRTLF